MSYIYVSPTCVLNVFHIEIPYLHTAQSIPTNCKVVQCVILQSSRFLHPQFPEHSPDHALFSHIAVPASYKKLSQYFLAGEQFKWKDTNELIAQG